MYQKDIHIEETLVIPKDWRFRKSLPVSSSSLYISFSAFLSPLPLAVTFRLHHPALRVYIYRRHAPAPSGYFRLPPPFTTPFTTFIGDTQCFDPSPSVYVVLMTKSYYQSINSEQYLHCKMGARHVLMLVVFLLSFPLVGCSPLLGM